MPTEKRISTLSNGRYYNLPVLFILIMIALLMFGCGNGGNSGKKDTYKVYGLDFSPFIDGQDPNWGSQVDEAQLKNRLEVVAPYTEWIRTFGCRNGLEKTGQIAHELGLKSALGAWIGAYEKENEIEIENLIAAVNDGDSDMLIIGSEVLLRGDVTEDELVNYIYYVKQMTTDIPVAYADVYSEILDHPAVVDASDVILVNYYPYWEGIVIENAVASIHRWHEKVTRAANGKPVVVSETGWPSDGDTVGNAVASSENASRFFLNFVSWARANDVPYFYFEAFDENWKAAYEGPQGSHWGIWDKEGKLKSGMAVVFNGHTMADNWSDMGMVGGPGDPEIEFIRVPVYGSYTNLEGWVRHVNPGEFNVAVYIYVNGWWTKPTWARPLTTIQIDGTWICDITTGGADSTATRVAAFLVPVGYDPPSMSGGSVLPLGLYEQSVAQIEITRRQ